MVAASATAILNDINLSSFRPTPFTERQISLQPNLPKPCKATRFAPVLPTHSRSRGLTNRFPRPAGAHSMPLNKGNVANKVNDLKTTLVRKRARRAVPRGDLVM
jgi:hypothetical protein